MVSRRVMLRVLTFDDGTPQPAVSYLEDGARARAFMEGRARAGRRQVLFGPAGEELLRMGSSSSESSAGCIDSNHIDGAGSGYTVELAGYSHGGAAEYAQAVASLSALAPAVAAQVDPESVFEALTVLELTIIRAYGGKRPRARPGTGGKPRILAYLQQRSGEWVYGEELAAVSGIGEWARRVRELRVEDGYPIQEQGGRYRLDSVGPEEQKASRWKLLNETRRRPGAARDRVLELFKMMVGDIVTRDDLDYVARIKEGSRRARELRDELGWPIESHVDARDLKPGQYRLVSVAAEDRRDVRQRLYADDLRHKVFERDGYTCQCCGRDRQLAGLAGDSRFYLEVHHLQAVAEELNALPTDRLNDLENLVTYCHGCHLKETSAFQRRRREERRVSGSQEEA